MKKTAYFTAAIAALLSITLFTTPTHATELIGEARAKEIALQHAQVSPQNARFTKMKVDKDDGCTEYEVEFYADGTEYEYDIDAHTGKIVKFSHEKAMPQAAPAKGRISEVQAKKIALERLPGAQEKDIVKFKLDHEHGREVYEGKILNKGRKYEFKIDATNGDVIEWELDD